MQSPVLLPDWAGDVRSSVDRAESVEKRPSMVARTFARPKTLVLAVVVLSAMVLFACGSGAASQPTTTPTLPPSTPVPTPTPFIDFHPVIGTPFTLTTGAIAILNGNGASLRFDGVLSDNRCPLNVQCITGGAAVVEMTASLSPSSPEEKWMLGIGPDTTEPSMRTLAGLDVELQEVEPVPGDSNSDGTVRVRLVVTTSPNSPT